jgi:hypothetical protein
MTEEQKQALRGIARWAGMSFPNGSSYRMQELPHGQHGEIFVDARIYGTCYLIRWPDGSETHVSRSRRSVGRGADFGANFCSRDQALIALI